jgi:ATP-dependent DNA helicase UvrD/PcrA
MGMQTHTENKLSQLKLTPDQQRAVEYDAGPLIVLAGPGTGKTRVITARVAHMIANRGIDPERIVAVTFTNKAAGELGERLGELVGATTGARVVASTFHSLGLGIVRRFGDVLGVPAEPMLIDSSQRRQLIRDLIRQHGLYKYALGSGIESAVEMANSVMNELRNLGKSASDALDWLQAAQGGLDALEHQEREARAGELDRFEQGVEVYLYFESSCRDRGWLVYDDLIMLPSKLMREHAQIAAMLRQDHQHVVVDEFQDVNAAQIELIAQLCPPVSNPDLCVVGDDDQSIYGFRGADERAFAHFDGIYGSPMKITLSTNFRSSSAIVDASNAVIGRAIVRFDDQKEAVSHAGEVSGSRVELVRLEGEPQSGEVIAAMLLEMASDRKDDPEWGFGTCAVIARTKNELEGIARVLMLEGIPVDIRQQASPMDDEGVMDVMAWARVLCDPDSSVDLKRILVRPPYRCDPIKLGGLMANWRVVRSRWSEGDSETPDPGGLLAWLVAKSDGELGEAIGSMHALAVELGKVASESKAAQAVLEIIKRSGAAHRELLDGRARARRIAALVALVRFASSRGDRFDSPGDLGAMLRYWADLDPNEQGLGELPEDRVVDANDGFGNDDDTGAVAMLTAHASKGLEFETVFVPRVSGPHGFPKTSGGDEEVLPEGLIDRAGDVRDPKSRRIDEERRVFYVALTRAERRAVVLAKVPKKPSSVNFVFELRDSLGGDFAELDAGDVLDPGAGSDALSRLGAEFKAMNRMRDVFDEAKGDARRLAGSALDAIELGERDRDETGDRLKEASDRLAIINAVLKSGKAPAWTKGTALAGFANGLVEALSETQDEASSGIYPGLKGPLKLSFTQIAAYIHCPRCYLVERVLGLPSDEQAPAVVGKAVHEALEHFYKRWQTADAEGEVTPGAEVLDELIKDCFFRHWPREIEVDADKLEQARAMGATVWEKLHHDDAHIEELEKKHTLEYVHDGVTHTIRAVLDRVDATDSGGRRVIDYKTGKARKDLAEPKKDDLQLGIYAMALANEYGDPGPGSVCEYWLLQDGSVGSIAMDSLDIDKIRKRIDKAITGMLAGDWSQSTRCKNGRWESACSILDEVGEIDELGDLGGSAG